MQAFLHDKKSKVRQVREPELKAVPITWASYGEVFVAQLVFVNERA